jgi:hypothetical protein
MFVETKKDGEALPVTPSAKDVLVAARAKIAEPENWCQGCQGLDKDGCGVNPLDSDAVKHCALGALSAVIGSYVLPTHPARVVLQRCVPGPIGPWNNRHSHTEVVAAFDAAIACISGQAQGAT